MKLKTPGHATTAGTASYPLLWGRTGLKTYPVGFGCYRIHDADLEHAESLRLALQSGCNLIDTSTNYGDGHSELLVGKVLRELFEAQALQRDQVIVVTKVGYVQGQNLDQALQAEKSGRPFRDMVKVSDHCWHCLDPEWIRGQIAQSRDRLQLESLDAVLLHNPEYFLKTSDDHEEYYRRIHQALLCLEEEVTKGTIRRYGISSNTFIEAKDHPEFTSLALIWEQLHEKLPNTHFEVIQFPMNPIEIEAVVENNNDSLTLLEFAERHRLATMINRPLNAFTKRELVRFASFEASSVSVTEVNRLLEEVCSLEAQLPDRRGLSPRDYAWAHILKQNWNGITDYFYFKDLREHQIEPALQAGYRLLAESTQNHQWIENHRLGMANLLSKLENHLRASVAQRSESLRERMQLKEKSATLSQATIQTLRSFSGVQVVLVGMRQRAYVRDALALLDPVAPAVALERVDRIHAWST